jgi:hypothetical protein
LNSFREGVRIKHQRREREKKCMGDSKFSGRGEGRDSPQKARSIKAMGTHDDGSFSHELFGLASLHAHR